MNIIKKVFFLLQTLKKAHSFKSLCTAKRVYDLYGFQGLKLAIKNKNNGVDLLKNISLISPVKRDNEFGNILLKQQQDESLKIINDHEGSFEYRPLISFVMPVYNAPVIWLVKALESIINQKYTNWELCAVNDASPNTECIDILKEYAAKDSRIKLYNLEKNSGISHASNVAVTNAEGEYIALIDQDDEISLDALWWNVYYLNNNGKQVDFIFTDECKINEDGYKFDFIFKPEWSLFLMINNMFTGHLTLYRTDLVRKVGGFDSNFDFGQDYEMAVRLGQVARNIIHIPRVLYYWRAISTSTAAGGKSFSNKINMAVPYKFFKEQGVISTIVKYGHYNYPRINCNASKVSIIIPYEPYFDISTNISRVLQDTIYPNFEVVVLAPASKIIELKNEFIYTSNIIFFELKDENIIKSSNEVVKVVTGDILVFLLGDCVPGIKEWIYDLSNTLMIPGIDAVSPVVIDTDGRIKYAGASSRFSNDNTVIGTPFYNRVFSQDTYNFILSSHVMRDCIALSKNCIAVKKNIFKQLGGFNDELTQNIFQDDFSFRVNSLRGNQGRCLYNPRSMVVRKKERQKGSGQILPCLLKWFEYYEADDVYFSKIMAKQSLHVEDVNEIKFYRNNVSELPSAKTRKILMITHELSRTGAPVVMLDAAVVLKKAGYYVVVASPFDGELRAEYERENIPVLIDIKLAWERCKMPECAKFDVQWYMDDFINDFDMIFICTIMGHNLIARYQDSDIPIFWWLHEGSYSLDLVEEFLPKNITSNVHVYCGGKYVQNMLKKYNIDYKNEVLLYGVDDFYNKVPVPNKKSNKIRFIIAGSIDERKGQDIVFRAIERLSKDLLNKVEFMFIGARSFGDVYDKIMSIQDKYDNVTFRDPVPREELFQIYQDADVIICASRDDPMPVVVTEMMMLSKIVICSSHVGTSEYIVDGVNGYTFKNESAEDLVVKMTTLIGLRLEHRISIGSNARKTYIDLFSEDIFKEKLLDAVANQVLQ